MQRVVDVNGIGYYVIYHMNGDEVILHGIACSSPVVLYEKGIAHRLHKFEKISLDEAEALTLEPQSTKSFESLLIESLTNAHKMSARMARIIR